MYSTSLVSHQKETVCELIFVAASEWKHMMSQNSTVKANLSFSILMDTKRSSLDDTTIQSELKMTRILDTRAMNHVTAHALKYRERDAKRTGR